MSVRLFCRTMFRAGRILIMGAIVLMFYSVLGINLFNSEQVRHTNFNCAVVLHLAGVRKTKNVHHLLGTPNHLGYYWHAKATANNRTWFRLLWDRKSNQKLISVSRQAVFTVLIFFHQQDWTSSNVTIGTAKRIAHRLIMRMQGQ